MSVKLVFLALLCLVSLLATVAVVAVVIYARRQQMPGRQAGETSALDILKARYARGEITREQFEEMRSALEE